MKQVSIKDVLFQILCFVIGLVVLIPLLYCVLCSFMQETEIISKELQFFPKKWSIENYVTVIRSSKILRFMLNSLVVSLVSSISRVITASMAAYAFTFFEFKGKKILFAMVVGSMIIPAEMLMVQNYFTTAELNLINTYMGMSIIFMVLCANIFLIRQNFRGFAAGVREAALVDGCGNWRFFSQVLLPISKPILATVFISSFVTTWNTYLWPLIVTNKNEMRTVQVIITMLNKSELNTAYGQVMAAAVLILIPSIIVFAVFQRRITEGMMAGAVKE